MAFPIIAAIIAAAGSAIVGGIRAAGQAQQNRAVARGAEAQREQLLELVRQIQNTDTTSSRIDSAVRSAGALQAARGLSGSQIGQAETAGTIGRIVSEDEARRQQAVGQILSQDVFSAARPEDLQSPLAAGLLGGLGGLASGAAQFAGANPEAFALNQSAPKMDVTQFSKGGGLPRTGAAGPTIGGMNIGAALAAQQSFGRAATPQQGAFQGFLPQVGQTLGQAPAQQNITAGGFLPLLVPRARAGQRGVFP